MSRCACPVCYSLSAGRGENLSAGQLSAVDGHVSDACTAAVSESRWCKLSSRFLFWMQDCTRPTCTTLSGVYLCVLESGSACLSPLWFDNIWQHCVWLLHRLLFLLDYTYYPPWQITSGLYNTINSGVKVEFCISIFSVSCVCVCVC